MQNDLASPHVRRCSIGEDEIDRLFKFVLRQTVHVRCVPVVDFSRASRERREIWHFFRSRRPERVWQSLQVMLEDYIDRMDVVEDAKHDRGILFGQPVEIPANHIVQAAIGPSLVAHKW